MLHEYIQKHKVESNFNTSDVLDIVAHYIDEQNCDDMEQCLIRRIHESVHGKHFDEDCAIRTVAKMFYCKESADTKSKVFGAFVSLEQSNKIYARFKDDLHKDYNQYDFYVTLNMSYADNFNLFHKWFKDVSDEAMLNIVAEYAINWLADDDSPYEGHTKIWSYLKHC